MMKKPKLTLKKKVFNIMDYNDLEQLVKHVLSRLGTTVS